MNVQTLSSVAEWHLAHGGALFRTRASVDWLIKKHRHELIAAGVLLPGKGRAGSLVDGERFGAVALEIVRRERGGRQGAE